MPTCIATLKNGFPCDAPSRYGFLTCGWHRSFVAPPPTVVCAYVNARGRTCRKHASAEDDFCPEHARLRDYDRNARETEDQIRDWMWSDTPPRTFEEAEVIVDRIFRADLIDTHQFRVVMDWLTLEWEWFVRTRPPPNVVARSELHGLSLDTQNVHTQVVSRQTSDALTLLLDTPVPSRPCTLAAVKHAWDGRSGRSRVVRDMDQWYSTPECRVAGDWLYRRALDGLWIRIQSSPHKDDLIARLWEECSESVGMCAEGHLSRIANVLVGFDMNVRAEVSVGELLQQKVAAISALDVPIEQKVGKVWGVLEELAVPMDQRVAWIDAL